MHRPTIGIQERVEYPVRGPGRQGGSGASSLSQALPINLASFMRRCCLEAVSPPWHHNESFAGGPEGYLFPPAGQMNVGLDHPSVTEAHRGADVWKLLHPT